MTQPENVEIYTIYEQDVDALKHLVGDHGMTDQQLAEFIAANLNSDRTVNLDRSAEAVWKKKAADYADLVDVTEGNSSRKMAQLHKNALAMVDYYQKRLTTLVHGTTRGNVVIGSIAPRAR